MSPPSTVLVTGGAGFIGSHACAELLDHGYELIVVDDYSNSTPQVFTRMQRVAGRFVGAVYELDIRDRQALSAVFHRHAVDAVVHFAALKSAGRSARLPLEYYDTNIAGTTALLRTMQEHGVHRLIFSSTCSIYGEAAHGPLDESAPAHPANPFAASKWVCEQILADVCARRPEYAVMCLRYFNPVGAHPSGLLGEAPRDPPGKLMPSLAKVAAGQRDRLRVYGTDYPTPDGTAIRDYVHVMDTVEALRVALDRLGDQPGMRVYNLGRGEGSSVLDVITQFSRTTGHHIPTETAPRRLGDVAEYVADARAAARDLCWRPTRDLDAMCRDAWRFQRLHPNGYAESPRRPKSKEY